MTEQWRQDLWLSRLDAERVHRYHLALADRYLKEQLVVKYLMGAAAVAIAAPIPDAVASWVNPLASVAIFAALIVEQIKKFSEKHATLRIVADECGELAMEWGDLWRRSAEGQFDQATSMEKDMELRRRLRKATSRGRWIGLREDSKLHEKITEETYAVAQHEHVTA